MNISKEKYMNRSSDSIDDLISLEEASKISGLSSAHLRHLVSSGKVWGMKIGRNWVTKKSAIEAYLKKKRKPGRPSSSPL